MRRPVRAKVSEDGYVRLSHSTPTELGVYPPKRRRRALAEADRRRPAFQQLPAANSSGSRCGALISFRLSVLLAEGCVEAKRLDVRAMRLRGALS